MPHLNTSPLLSSLSPDVSSCLVLQVETCACNKRFPSKISSFEHLDNMEKMDLSYNQLTSLGRGVFKGLSRLRQLYLNNNRLIVLQQGSLDMLPTLEVRMETSVFWTRCMCLKLTVRCVQVLQLSNNNISQIDGESLAPLYSLAMLALDGNQLQHLKFKTFINLHTTATHIQLSGLQPLLF